VEISELTRRDIVDHLLLQERQFHGKVGLISFLKRIWDLAAMPSSDPRHSTAEGDINRHMILNEDWSDDYLLLEYLDLPGTSHEIFTRFLETHVHPAITLPDDDVALLVAELNAYLHLDGFELQQHGEIARRPLYRVRAIDPVAAAFEDIEVKSDEPQPPFTPDDLTGTLIEIFMARGSAREVAILTFAVEYSFSGWTYDDWAGGTYYWALLLRIPPRVFGLLSQDDISASETDILQAARDLLKGVCGHGLGEVHISASVRTSPNIREEALHWLNGEGLSNQGRVRSTNIAAREEDGLLFRSQPEIFLYRALKSRGVTMAPLPVFLRGGSTYMRIEPDFVLWSDRVLMIVEVDGSTVHRETPVEADQRVSMFKDEGAFIQRISASECATEEKARRAADSLIQTLEKLKRQR